MDPHNILYVWKISVYIVEFGYYFAVRWKKKHLSLFVIVRSEKKSFAKS